MIGIPSENERSVFKNSCLILFCCVHVDDLLRFCLLWVVAEIQKLRIIAR